TLIEKGGVISLSSDKDFDSTMSHLLINDEERKRIGTINSNYIKENSGSVDHIMNILNKNSF
ncbi:MAG: 3-deoxy-D-manno-octulosonic acid transferase, partial [Bacteroidota bacterium]